VDDNEFIIVHILELRLACGALLPIRCGISREHWRADWTYMFVLGNGMTFTIDEVGPYLCMN
jgi:hypothetical protein